MLFGTPHLEGPAGALPSPGPRRLALLAALAAAGAAGLTRDRLVALLWPEADDDRAKRNLSQLLYAMRTEFGADLVEGTGTLRLDPATSWSDVIAFDTAIAARRDAEALTLYRGPFLDGFHLAESAEFSHWADAERERRAVSARGAAQAAAEVVPAADTHAAAAAWRRVLSLDPLNHRIALRLMDALEADGDRAGALKAGEQYAARVRVELESAPAGEVVARLEVLRSAPAAPAATVGAPNASRARVPETDAAGGAAGVGHAPATSAGRDSARIPASWRASPRLLAAAAALLAAALLAVALVALAWSNRSTAALREGEFVLLAEFANHTSDTLLTRTVGTAVAAALQQSGVVVSLPRSRVTAALGRMQRPDSTERLPIDLAREVAQREAVRLVLDGEVLEAGGVRQIVTRISDARSGRILRTRTYRMDSEADLLPTIDRLAAQMRRDLGEAGTSIEGAVPLPAVTTASLPALYLYAAALDAVRVSNESLAASLFTRAVTLDSTFASAHAQLGAFYNRNNDVPRATFHFGRALAQADRLPLEETQRIRIMAAFARGDITNAVETSRQYLALRPRDAGAWARLGYYLFANGQQAQSREAYARSDELAPLSAGSYLNVGTSWLSEARVAGDVAFDSALTYYRRAIADQPSLEYNTFYNHQYGAILVGAGLADSARASFTRMAARDVFDRARGLRSLGYLDAMEGRWLDAADGFARAADLSANGRQWTSALRNYALMADLLIILGDATGARAPLARAAAIAFREPLETQAVIFAALAHVRAGDLATARRLLERMRFLARAEHGAEQAAILTVEGALALAEGRASDARGALGAALLRDSTRTATHVLLARSDAALGADSSAAAAWELVERRFSFGVEGQFDWQLAAYEHGRALEALGRTEQALEAYRRSVGRYPPAADVVEAPALRDARARISRLEQRR